MRYLSGIILALVAFCSIFTVALQAQDPILITQEVKTLQQNWEFVTKGRGFSFSFRIIDVGSVATYKDRYVQNAEKFPAAAKALIDAKSGRILSLYSAGLLDNVIVWISDDGSGTYFTGGCPKCFTPRTEWGTITLDEFDLDSKVGSIKFNKVEGWSNFDADYAQKISWSPIDHLAMASDYSDASKLHNLLDSVINGALKFISTDRELLKHMPFFLECDNCELETVIGKMSFVTFLDLVVLHGTDFPELKHVGDSITTLLNKAVEGDEALQYFASKKSGEITDLLRADWKKHLSTLKEVATDEVVVVTPPDSFFLKAMKIGLRPMGFKEVSWTSGRKNRYALYKDSKTSGRYVFYTGIGEAATLGFTTECDLKNWKNVGIDSNGRVTIDCN